MLVKTSLYFRYVSLPDTTFCQEQASFLPPTQSGKLLMDIPGWLSFATQWQCCSRKLYTVHHPTVYSHGNNIPRKGWPL